MRMLAVLLLVCACKDKAPPTITELADEMCKCKDVACRDDVAIKVKKLLGELAPDQLAAHVKDVEQIDMCSKSNPEETR